MPPAGGPPVLGYPVAVRRTISILIACILCLPAVVAAQSPAPVATGYVPGTVTLDLEPFAEGLAAPVALTPDGTGSRVLYAVEQGGTVRAIGPDGAVSADAFLDITDRVTSGGEQGLLGMAFHPAYATNGRLFVYYTGQGGDAQIVSELHATGGVADPASERVLLAMPDFAGNHNGGMLAFDSEGMLLIGTGDGGGGGDPEANGQDDTQLLGKLLRIDVDGGDPYGVPANDPEARLGAGIRPEIRATGLRNPWRFSVDRATGDVFIGDVGQGAWEEVDVLPAGQGGLDFGWSIMEGPDCYAVTDCDRTGLTLPVAAYSHAEGDCTIVGGHVYRGSAFPGLEGAYIYGDYCSGKLWVLPAADAIATGTSIPELVGQLDGSLSAFGEDEAGELYAVDLDGRVLRLSATIAGATASPPPASSEPSTTPTAEPSRSPAGADRFRAGRVKLRLEQVADLGLDAFPIYLTGDGTGQGRLYVPQRNGLIRIMDKRGRNKGTLLDLRGRVGMQQGSERGLLGLAFHPRFAKNGKFYVHYNTPAGNTRIVEYRQRRAGQEVGAGSGRVLFDFPRPEWNHNGGWIDFGPDGYLYIASGDGGGNSPGDPFGNGQDRNDLFGSILRIDVDKGRPYAIPKDNPFRGKAGRDELWNYGLRNPWRASFDRETGDLWIGDVGQDSVEEIDIQPAGKGGLNFGWSIMEGSRCHQRSNCSTRGLTMPVAEYAHGAKGCSVIGGYVYRGTESPLLRGAYLFTDYCSKSIYAIDASQAKAGADLSVKRLVRKNDSLFVSMGEDDEGELYVLSQGGGIYHLVGKPRS